MRSYMDKKHPLQEHIENQGKITPLERMRNHFYANSPFDLASKNDDKYRDAVDETLDELYGAVVVGEHNPEA